MSHDPDFRLLDHGTRITRLLGTPTLAAGLDIEVLLARDLADHACWRRERQPALLHRVLEIDRIEDSLSSALPAPP